MGAPPSRRLYVCGFIGASLEDGCALFPSVRPACDRLRGAATRRPAGCGVGSPASEHHLRRVLPAGPADRPGHLLQRGRGRRERRLDRRLRVGLQRRRSHRFDSADADTDERLRDGRRPQGDRHGHDERARLDPPDGKVVAAGPRPHRELSPEREQRRRRPRGSARGNRRPALLDRTGPRRRFRKPHVRLELRRRHRAFDRKAAGSCVEHRRQLHRDARRRRRRRRLGDAVARRQGSRLEPAAEHHRRRLRRSEPGTRRTPSSWVPTRRTTRRRSTR